MKLRIVVGAGLFLSLAANAFFAGWLLSAPAPVANVSEKRAAPMRVLMRELRGLPDPERGEALAVVRGYVPKLRERARALHDARARMRDLLSGEDYSRGQAEAQFERVREASTALQSLAQTMTLDLADRLPAQTRAELIERMSLQR